MIQSAAIETDFDKSIGKINIIPQDIGRVLLNLFNNAFYAVNARLNESFGQEQKTSNPVSYNPTVSVGTEKCEDKIYITVRDNGNGIPQNIVDKIFQPFFTTKPTGEGTGPGLSPSYDIVKAHGGEIKVESKGEGTTFKIELPEISSNARGVASVNIVTTDFNPLKVNYKIKVRAVGSVHKNETTWLILIIRSICKLYLQ
jgi:signal transduction histidine kinase